VKIFSIILLVIISSGCSTIDVSVFETYNDNVSSNVSFLEENMTEVSSLGQELFIIEASLNQQEILDIEYDRNSPYEISLTNEPFYLTVRNTIQSLERFNTFLISYSNALLTIASNDFNSVETIIAFDSSLKGISEELDLSDDIINYSISSISVLINNISNRLSYRARVKYLQDISIVSNDIILEMLDEYINLIDNLEAIMFDYYYRTFIAIENIMFEEEDFYKRRELSRELVELSEDYRSVLSSTYTIRNNFVRLKETQEQLNDMIMNEDFDEQTITDFIIQNYEFYEELE
jgi:hypothetical protein